MSGRREFDRTLDDILASDPRLVEVLISRMLDMTVSMDDESREALDDNDWEDDAGYYGDSD